MSVIDRYAELRSALSGQTGFRVQAYGEAAEPPCVIVQPADLAWQLMQPEPSAAQLRVAAIVPSDDRALERVTALGLRVAELVDGLADFAIRDAVAGEYGSTNLPCYMINIEVAL
jgi:hypothetical protein